MGFVFSLSKQDAEKVVNSINEKFAESKDAPVAKFVRHQPFEIHKHGLSTIYVAASVLLSTGYEKLCDSMLDTTLSQEPALVESWRAHLGTHEYTSAHVSRLNKFAERCVTPPLGDPSNSKKLKAELKNSLHDFAATLEHGTAEARRRESSELRTKFEFFKAGFSSNWTLAFFGNDLKNVVFANQVKQSRSIFNSNPVLDCFANARNDGLLVHL